MTVFWSNYCIFHGRFFAISIGSFIGAIVVLLLLNFADPILVVIITFLIFSCFVFVVGIIAVSLTTATIVCKIPSVRAIVSAIVTIISIAAMIIN